MLRKTFSTLVRKNSATLQSSLLLSSISKRCRFSSTSSDPILSSFDAILLGVYKDGSLTDTTAEVIPKDLQQTIKEKLRFSDAKGKLGETRLFYGLGGENFPKKIAVVNLGVDKNADEEEFEVLERARKAASIGVRSLREVGAKNIGVDVMIHEHGTAEGATLGLYRFDGLKSAKNQKSPVSIEPIGSLSTKELSWNTGLIYASAQNHARTLAETPANHMTPTVFVESAVSLLQDIPNVEIRVHDKEWVAEKGMGSFLSVAKGSDEPLKFLEIHYNGGEKESKPLALIGKGVTFDSGGISIKPSAKMAEMKADMSGGAVVVSALFGIAKLGFPINVIVSIPLCENMPSGRATKPGDVVKAMNGKSIEVDNTDAEGRLILADALYYTSSTYQPHSLIDVATLTGAMYVALGEIYSGVFTNSNKLWEQLSQAGRTANDPFWRMPLDDSYSRALKKSTVADLVNVGDRGGGACTAAIFLKEFVSGLTEDDMDESDEFEKPLNALDADDESKIRYAHIDMAGSMQTTQDSGYDVKGMTGRPTRSIIEFARIISESKLTEHL
ncbi:944_t:CDS:2 [Acaulospora morrowiae]|uniref:944_t:CDS:1 n=1 Tax=Acaulospora morrowiae TaxID=94023 RepID=A0A9N9D4H0_9GLOM|nr:944_t:CDS:2 [Acaulospora morrowiae]